MSNQVRPFKAAEFKKHCSS